AALTGWVYDARGPSVLLAVPVLTALVPALVFAPTLTPVLVGVTLWGAASGIQDSTVKALVADLVVPARRGSMYGWISVCQGSGAFAGATLAGFLYGSLSALVGIVVALQAAALVLLVIVLRRRRHDGVAPQPPVTA
ncbi:MAG: MFS transporter, partial [Propionicimonas sp.]